MARGRRSAASAAPSRTSRRTCSARAIEAALERSGVAPAEVDEVVMGQVGQVGPDAYNARRCALAAGIPPASTAMNVNRLCGAEHNAERHGIGRAEQDAFAARSQQRAEVALRAGHFEREIVPVAVPDADEPISRDETPRPGVTAESLARLRPAFREGGSVTAGNASGINDGAAAVVMMRASEAARRGLAPRMRLLAAAVSGIEPEVMGYAPALTIPKLLDRVGIALAEVELIELNEAFAAQALAVIRDTGLDEARVNPSGGAIALGHPVGATGAILTVKLMYALERLGARLGLVTMCIGGGQGIAALFQAERP